MADKKSGRKRSKRKKPVLYPALAVVVLLLTAAVSLFYLVEYLKVKPVPVYEEVFIRSGLLADETARVDRTVYELLYREKIDEENILFSEVIPRHTENYDWNFTELMIRLSSVDSLDRLMKILSRGLYELKPSISLRKEIVSQRQVLFHVYINDLYTHKIELTCVPFEHKRDPKSLPRVAIIIDDIGYDRELAASFMNIGFPIVLSVLPMGPYSEDIAARAGERGCELLLHLPMEPKGYPEIDPGKGALLTSMDEKTIGSLTRKYVKMVPGVKGVNNHMGSSFTERQDKMRFVLKELKNLDLFFVDSRTTNRTVAYDLARSMNIPAAKKSVFLDHLVTTKAIRYQMERLLSVAAKSGSAVGIGHPHAETLNVLKEYSDRLKMEYSVVPVSEITE